MKKTHIAFPIEFWEQLKKLCKQDKFAKLLLEMEEKHAVKIELTSKELEKVKQNNS